MEAAPGGGGSTPYPHASTGQPLGGPVGDHTENSFMRAAEGIAGAVAEGKLAITKEGGEALIQALDEYQQWYTSRANILQIAAQAPKLGSSNAAKVVSPYMEQVGTDAHGYVTQMTKLAQAVDKFKESIHQAMAAYGKTDQEAAHQVTKSGSDLHGS